MLSSARFFDTEPIRGKEAAGVGVEYSVVRFIASGSRRARDRRLPAQHAERSS